jgi:DNA-binding MarR family transcriptional regulator
MSVPDPRSDAARRFAALVADVYELAGELAACGERIARHAGQSGARWKVLSAASVGGQTVPQLARRLGLARQSVQRVCDALEDEGLVEYRDNPDHRRSARVDLTSRGTQTLSKLSAAAAEWENPLARRMDRAELERARALVRPILGQLRAHPPAHRRRQ